MLLQFCSVYSSVIRVCSENNKGEKSPRIQTHIPSCCQVFTCTVQSEKNESDLFPFRHFFLTDTTRNFLLQWKFFAENVHVDILVLCWGGRFSVFSVSQLHSPFPIPPSPIEIYPIPFSLQLCSPAPSFLLALASVRSFVSHSNSLSGHKISQLSSFAFCSFSTLKWWGFW